MQRQGVEDDLRDEAERALGADHQSAQDLHGRRTVQEGVQAVAVGVLDLVLRADPGRQRAVRLDLRLEGQQPGAQLRLGVRQLRVGLRITRVHDGPGRQYERQGMDRAVRVAGGARRHAGGVVRHDAAHGAGDGARRVRAQYPVVAREGGVGPYDGGAGLDTGSGAVAQDLDARPVPAHVDEDVLALRLPVQRGARGPEDHLTALAVGVGEDGRDVVHVLGEHDDLRHEAVRARVGGIAHQVGDLPQHLLRAEQRLQLAAQRLRRALGTVARDAVGGGRPRRGRPECVGVGLQQRHGALLVVRLGVGYGTRAWCVVSKCRFSVSGSRNDRYQFMVPGGGVGSGPGVFSRRAVVV